MSWAKIPADAPEELSSPAIQPELDPISLPSENSGAKDGSESQVVVSEASERVVEGPNAPESASEPQVANIATPPPVPPVIDIEDLDWGSLRSLINAGDIRSRIANTVARMEKLVGGSNRALMLFDPCRASPDDRAIQVADTGDAALWFIGDLHGDLLALEAALALIRDHPKFGTRDSRVIFLGDLFDDEGFGLEVLLRIFELILENPAAVCIIAGNHDEALGHDGSRFTSTVSPSDFSEFLNKNQGDEWMVRAGKLAIRLFNTAPRALFFPDGLLVAHGGFPLADLHSKLEETGDWNNPCCLSDFVWARAHPTARKKLPNRFTRGSQFGHEDFGAFCSVASSLGRPVTHMVRGHDHVDDRFQTYPAYRTHPILTTVALSRRLSREFIGTYEREPTVALYTKNSVPQVFRLRIPPELVREFYLEVLEAAGNGGP
jgi:hypothetical protein